MTRTTGTALAVTYVAAVGVLAVLGVTQEKAAYLLSACALTLPCGIAALVGIYAGYAALGMIVPLLGAHRYRPDGSDPAWLTVSNGSWTVLVLLVAACGNVLLLRLIRRRRATATVTLAPQAPGGDH